METGRAQPIQVRPPGWTSPLAWATGAAGLAALLATLEPNPLEEGIALHIAERLARGEALYVDIVHFTGPLPFELLAALFRLLGQEIAVARGAVVLLLGLATASAVALGRDAERPRGAHVVGAAMLLAPAFLFPLLTLYFYATIAFYLTWLACFAAARGRRSSLAAVCAGVLVACVALCSQRPGSALAVALGVTLAWTAPSGARLARSLSFAGGGVAVAAFTLAVYAGAGRLTEFVEAMVWLPWSLEESFAVPLPRLWPPGASWTGMEFTLYAPGILALSDDLRSFGTVLLAQVLYVIPFAALAAAFVLQGRRRLPVGVWFVVAGLVAWLVNLYPRADWGHLVFVLPFAGVLATLLAREWGPRTTSAACCALVATGVACTGLLVWLSRDPALGPRVSLRPVTDAPALGRVVGYLRSNLEPDEPIFVARREPLVYFATGARNPTRYAGLFPAFREQQEREIVAALSDVRWVVMSDFDQLNQYYGEQLPGVLRHIERFFALPADFPLDPRTTIYPLRRSADRGVTLVDLEVEQGRARRWIRDTPGVERPVEDPLPRAGLNFLRRPVLLPLGNRGGGIDYELVVPPDARFEADVGLHVVQTEEGLMSQVWVADLELSVVQGRRALRLLTTRVDKRKGDLYWRPVAVDLRPFAGKRVTLRLEARPRGYGQPWAWWGSPRITRAAEASAARLTDASRPARP